MKETKKFKQAGLGPRVGVGAAPNELKLSAVGGFR
jgi:hypothetical protein